MIFKRLIIKILQCCHIFCNNKYLKILLIIIMTNQIIPYEFNRGLIIVEPYGTFIRRQQKNIIVKTKRIESIIKKKLLLIENKKGFGFIQLAEPKKINIQQFISTRKYHKITDADRKKWWPNYTTLYAYRIISKKFFKIPLLLNYPNWTANYCHAKKYHFKKN